MDKNLKSSLWAIGLTIVLSALPSVSKADSIIYTNFGPGMSFATEGGWPLCGNQNPSFTDALGKPVTIADAMAFVPAGNFDLTQIDVAIGLVSGTNFATLSLNSDARGVPEL
jgi:hypothetical protein